MSSLIERLKDLSPEKRELFLSRLKERGKEYTPILPGQSGTVDEIPLAYPQQRLWFLSQYQPESPFYTMPFIYRLHGPIDISLLEQCLNDIVERHTILRTAFAVEDGRPRQVV